MTRLVAQTPCAGLLPLEIGTVRITEAEPGPLHLIAPFDGQSKVVSAALKDALGAGLPAPNRSIAKEGTRTLWVAPGQALLIGAEPPDLPCAAVSDQSDAYTVVEIASADAVEVLARLVPVDLKAMKRGHTARTLIGHMTGSVTRLGADRFELMVFRSMAGSLVHDLTEAMEAMAARRALATGAV